MTLPGALVSSLAEASGGTFDAYAYEYEFAAALERLWNRELFEIAPATEHRSLESSEDDVSFSIEAPKPTPWSIAFTPTFRKSIALVDKKLQGRVLIALSELSEAPVTSHGDTVKPLSGDLKGLWRYRLGDYRLVYEPRQESRMVMLLDFAARGGAYE